MAWSRGGPPAGMRHGIVQRTDNSILGDERSSVATQWRSRQYAAIPAVPPCQHFPTQRGNLGRLCRRQPAQIARFPSPTPTIWQPGEFRVIATKPAPASLRLPLDKLFTWLPGTNASWLLRELGKSALGYRSATGVHGADRAVPPLSDTECQQTLHSGTPAKPERAHSTI